MGQTDLAIRMLADLLQAQLVPALLTPARVEVLHTEQTELKIIERQTDKVVHARINGVETIVHVEFQASHTDKVPARVLVYLMHAPPVSGAVPCGLHRRPGDQLDFTYDVFCAWERPITLQEVRCTPTLAPLAPLTPGISAEDLPALQALLEHEVRPAVLSGELQALTVILASRRFPLDLLQLFLRSKAMLESSPGYQYFLSQGEARGEARGVRVAIARLVEHRLGPLPAELEARLADLELEALQALFDRVVEAEDAVALQALVGEAQ